MELKGYQRSYLTKFAHDLKPVVMIGRNGMSDSVIKAVDEALAIHELIKVKFVDFKESRFDLAKVISEKTESLLVRVVGNVAIYYREHEDKDKRNYKIPQ
ncbi:MAG: YhbY family RNA-binding protein [Spirochaetaceae bacterium]|jgi:RNA-binding protein|nr:YhbY family RNA-binding protein [Spirochaetaceae bacterium]